MQSLTFDLLSSQIGSHYHSAGIVGLLMALEAINDNPYDFEWSVTGNHCLTVSWSGDAQTTWEWLVNQTFQTINGMIILPTSGENPIFLHMGFLATVLQVPATRQLGELIEKTIEKVPYATKGVEGLIHQRHMTKIFGRKQKPIEVKSWALPNCAQVDLVPTLVSNLTAIALIFSPLTWAFYNVQELRGPRNNIRYTTALVAPVVTGFETMPSFKPQTPDAYVAANIEDACLHYASINNCAAHGHLYLSEKANRPAKIVARAEAFAAEGYSELREKLPNKIMAKKDSDECFVKANAIRGLACANILHGKPWYTGIGQDRGLLSEVQFYGSDIRRMMWE